METRGSTDTQTTQVKSNLPVEDPSAASPTRSGELSKEHFSYLRLFFFLVISVFLAEVVAMILIYELPPLPYEYVTLIDAGVMTILIFPILYFLSFQPLIRHIGKRRQAEEAVEAERQRFNNILEALPAYVVLLTPDYRVPFANRVFRERFGESKGKRCYEHLFRRSEPCEICETFRVLDIMSPTRWEWTGPDSRIYDVFDFPFTDADGSTMILEMGIDITEQKRAEDANRQLSRIVQQTEDIVVVTSRDGIIEYVNPAFERLTGYTKEEALGKTPRVIKSGLHDGQFYQIMWNTVLKGDVFQGEIANRTKSGEIFYEVKTITPLRDAQGNITHFVATGKDITQHKLDEEKLRKTYDELELHVWERTEELRIANAELEDEIRTRREFETELRESEQRLKRAQEISHLGSWELDLVSNQLSWSDEVYRIFGLQPQEFEATYEAFLEAVHPDDRAKVDAAYSGSLREGRDQYEIEHRVVRRASGEIRIVHEKCEHFRNEVGQIIRSVGMVHDITERQQAEEALRRAHVELEVRVEERTQEVAAANRDLLKEITERKEIERQLRVQTTAMEAAANGIIITDRQGKIQWANPALAQISGYDMYELIGQSMRIFKSGQNNADYYSRMWNIILSGEVWRGETINRRKDGSLYVEEQTITPVRDEDGQIAHFIAIKQDITKRKKDEKDLERQNKELQIISNAERSQRQFSEALVGAAFIVNKSLKLSEVLALILEQIREVIHYQLADIALLEGDSFYDACHHGDLPWPSSLMGRNNRFDLESFPLLREMRQSGRPILIRDPQQRDWIGIEGMDWVRSLLTAPLLVEQKVIGFVNLFSDQPEFFTAEMSNHLVAFAAHAAVAIQNAWLFEQVQASTERLQSLSRRLVEIQENERLYISRELHDEAGQVLTSLLVDLRLLEKNISEPKILQKIVTEMESSLNGVIENLHRIAMALRPASLDHVGLVAALRQHTESVAEKHGLHISFTSGGVIERLPANVETVLYRIVQEALTNIIRHAHATRIDVVLTVRDGKLIVIIEDDGIGFDPEMAPAGSHLGLFGMRERAEMIDAKLMIESSPGNGTTIMMEVAYVDTIASRG